VLESRGLAHARRLAALRLPAVLSGLCVLAAAAYLVGLLAAAALRLPFPYPLDGMEDSTLQMLRRIAAGQPPYVAPTLEFVPVLYAPLYYYVSALVALATGPSLIAPRLVSLLATCVSLILLYRLVARETSSRVLGLVSAATFAGSTSLSGTVFDLARIDALATCWTVSSVYALRSADCSEDRASARWLTVAGGVFAVLAACTKQTHAVVALAATAYVALVARERLLPLLAAVAISLAVVLVSTRALAGDWAAYYIFDLPRLHALDPDQLLGFWHSMILPRFSAPLVVGPLFLVGCLLRRDWRALACFGIFGATLLGLAWGGWANRGGSFNVLLPGYAGLSMLFGLGVWELRRLLQPAATAWVAGVYAMALCLAQLVVVAYNPLSTMPPRSEAWAGNRLSATIAALPGEVYAPRFTAWALAAGRPDQPNLVTVAEIMGEYSDGATPAGDAWRSALRDALADRRYDYVLWDPQEDRSEIFFALRGTDYVDVGPLFEPEDDFNGWKSRLTPDVHVWVPRERAVNSRIPVVSSAGP
jgi:4-amino-4-deoxy-L-arabinose transferase-like glycosyltransferase